MVEVQAYRRLSIEGWDSIRGSRLGTSDMCKTFESLKEKKLKNKYWVFVCDVSESQSRARNGFFVCRDANMREKPRKNLLHSRKAFTIGGGDKGHHRSDPSRARRVTGRPTLKMSGVHRS